MKRAVKWVGVILVVLVVAIGALLGWASWKSGEVVSRVITAHTVEFPVPHPEPVAKADGLETTTGDAGLGQATDNSKEARLVRAIARGKHLVNARYACTECHGKDFSGGVMVDDPALGRLLGPNITSGKGSVVSKYTIADWDRIVRHGIKSDGTPGAMPSEDFQKMSDQELSDIVAYIRSVPPVDNVVEPVSFGPVGKVLIATGKLPLSADLIANHDAAHPQYPPTTEVSPEFGSHLAGVCTGCHRADFSGGPIHAGDPNWLPAANLTTHENGLKGWSFDDFAKAMRELKRPDGSEIRYPMSAMAPYAKNMTDTELRALWAYIETLEAKPTGG